ncbi:extracellular solute-binding protein [Stackebrandtia endophytica]|uniref:Extracellular solute-binding protein n=2 Tax=Stackebrandtia endophytica TaxID=1496996 RepID=A0A543AWS6_9ACTN|nr:extracellular solute-binding protein [Stackebrandtia endophytica]
MLAVLAPVTGVALASAIGDVNQCRETVALEVAAAPEIAPVLREHAADWSSAARPSQGTCVSVTVTAIDSVSVAMAYANAAGLDLDVGDAQIQPVELPDVWIPESLLWPARLGGDLGGRLSDRIDPVAASPVGFGVDDAQLDAVFEGTPLDTVAVSLSDPRYDTASLALLMVAQEYGISLRNDADGVTPMSAAEVTAQRLAGNESGPTFVSPQPNVATFEYPYIAWSDDTGATKRGVEVFRSSLLTNAFTDRLTQYNLQVAGPYPAMPDVEVIERALADWRS